MGQRHNTNEELKQSLEWSPSKVVVLVLELEFRIK